MKILVFNIGSTSLKFRLFEMTGESGSELARGRSDRIGGNGGQWELTVAGRQWQRGNMDFADHEQCIRFMLERLIGGGILGDDGPDAVAFKAIMAGDREAVALVDNELIARMENFNDVAPAHNPPYIGAMRLLGEILPRTPMVAAFETGFHRSNPPRRRRYAVGQEWVDCGVVRYGFHGASHRYIATRTAELMDAAGRIISCHLGGSSSICAIRDGRSVATSMGLSPQTGLPQAARVGDFDAFALKLMAGQTGRTFDDLLDELGSRAGLAALSQTSGDMRDIHEAAGNGDERAKLALDVYVTAARDYVGAYLVELGGADALVFTGGIGTYDAAIRARICTGLEFAGISLDKAANAAATGECRIDAPSSGAAVWVIPTNEELVVARQAAELLAKKSGPTGGTRVNTCSGQGPSLENANDK